jgi:hypothetical protein
MRTRPGHDRALVETLEKRSLMSVSAAASPPVAAAADDPAADVTPPTLVGEQLLGTDPRQVTGVVLTFSEALDPVSAQDLKNFRVGRRTDQKQNYNPDNQVDQKAFKDGLIRFTSAVYDPVAFTVTLTPKEPFNITRKFRTIRVLARGPNRGVKDVAGNILDGDGNGKAMGDAVEQFTFRRAQRVQYEEWDGDDVTIWLTGPGRLWVLRNTPDGKVFGRGNALRLYVDKTDTSAVVTGKVEGTGDGVAVIDELINAYSADVQISQSAVFQILRTIP